MHPQTDLALGDRAGPPLHLRRLGFRSYVDACAVQEAAAASVVDGGADQLLLVEHPPIITLGRGFTPDQLLEPPPHLRRAGISVATTDRGGGATYHGPGQLVGYPIVDLTRRGLSVRGFLSAIETALVSTLRGEGIDAHLRPGLTGVWAAAGKLGAIGISVRRGVSRHGFALNVDTDLAAFEKILPCGLREPVTSMRALGWRGRPASLGSLIARRLATALTADSASGVPTPVGPAISSGREIFDGRGVWA